MKTKILFVNPPNPTYTQMVDEFNDRNHDLYGLADGDEASPTVTNEVQRGERKMNVSASMNLPLGISYLSSTLSKHFKDSLEQYCADYVNEQDRIHEHKNVDEWILSIAKESVQSQKPDIIAISLMFSVAYKFIKQVVRIYRKLWPDSIIIVGGIHATNCTQYMLETTPEIDYIFRGESEVAIIKFIQNFIDNKPQEIQGVYKKETESTASNFDHEGKSLNSKLCELHENLDEIPNHNYKLFNYEKYFQATKIFKRYDDPDYKVYEIMGSRGCPFKCSFCSSHSSNDRNVRKRSIENIMAEITHMYKAHGVTKILFNDDLFTMKKSRFFEMMKAFRESKIPNLQFYTQGFHINTTDEEMIDAVAGMTSSILFAVDSGSQYIQNKIIHKKNNLERGKELMSYAQKRNLIVRANFIFGFPTETKEIMEESANYMRSIESDWFQIFTAIPFIGTSLHEQLLERGILKKRFDEDLWERTRYGERDFDMDTITKEDLADYTYALNLELNFVKNFNIKRGKFDRAAKMINEILRNYPTHVFALVASYLAHEGLNDKKECLNLEKRILKSLSDDKSSQRMLKKHSKLLNETKFFDLKSDPSIKVQSLAV